MRFQTRTDYWHGMDDFMGRKNFVKKEKGWIEYEGLSLVVGELPLLLVRNESMEADITVMSVDPHDFS